MRSARAGVVRGAVVLAVVVLFAIPLRGGEPLGWGIAHGQTIPVGGGEGGGGGGGPAGPTIREEPGPTPPLQVVEVILTPPGSTVLGDGQVLGPQAVPTLSAGIGGAISVVAPADCVGPQIRGIVTQGGTPAIPPVIVLELPLQPSVPGSATFTAAVPPGFAARGPASLTLELTCQDTPEHPGGTWTNVIPLNLTD